MLKSVSIEVNFLKLEALNNMIAQYYTYMRSDYKYMSGATILDMYVCGVAREVLLFNISKMEKFRTCQNKKFKIRYKPAFVASIVHIMSSGIVTKGSYEISLINLISDQIYKQTA